MGVCGKHGKWLQLHSCNIWCKSVRKILFSCFFLLFWNVGKILLGLSAMRAPTVGPLTVSSSQCSLNKQKCIYIFIYIYIYIYVISFYPPLPCGGSSILTKPHETRNQYTYSSGMYIGFLFSLQRAPNTFYPQPVRIHHTSHTQHTHTHTQDTKHNRHSRHNTHTQHTHNAQRTTRHTT